MREEARTLFADTLGDSDLTALLVDAAGACLAGSYLDAEGTEIVGEIGSALSGVSTEVMRAMEHLQLGAWRSLIIETTDATIALAPVSGDAVVLLAASREEPHGLVRRILARAAARAGQWVTGEQR